MLAADLLANGERRIRDGHFEDAVVRAYRVLELLGQIRLFSLGLDSSSLSPNDPAVQQVYAKLQKSDSRDRFGQNPDGTLNAGRQLVARILKAKGDSLARRLLRLGEHDLLRSRNHSILIHGFKAVGLEDRSPLEAIYRELEEVVVADAGKDARRSLALARSLDFSRK
jgi:hypothetical protein